MKTPKFNIVVGERYRIALMTILLTICAALTYYFKVISDVDIPSFTHFFYIPTILSSFWWGRKGITVAVSLVILLVFMEVVVAPSIRLNKIIDEDLVIRAPIFLTISIVTALLTEQIEKKKSETAQSEAQIKLLYSTTKAINEGARDFSSAMELALKEVCNATGWIFGEFWTPSSDGEYLELGSAWHIDSKILDEFQKESVSFKFAPGIGLPGRAWATKKAVWVLDIKTDPAFLRSSIAQTANLGAGVAVPILAGGKVIAVMDFFLPESRKEEEMLIHLVSMVASHLGTVFERKKAEGEAKQRTIELIQIEKMASMGLLVAGVAHEINNPLAFIKSNTDFIKEDLAELKKQCKEKKDIQQAIEQMEKLLDTNTEGIKRIAKITKTLKTFAKPDAGERTPADINQGIKDTLIILQNQLKHRVQVHEEFGVLPQIECNIGQLNQVFMNMIMNASEAMDKGDMWIKTWTDNKNIYVGIKDNGQGIPSDRLNNIFDPFRSTKKGGTGLGLSVSYRIVQDHKGSIGVESEVGKGTTFTIRLPKEAGK